MFNENVEDKEVCDCFIKLDKNSQKYGLDQSDKENETNIRKTGSIERKYIRIKKFHLY